MLTAIEKIRQQLTADPDGEPYFQHEGPMVDRWITGGTAPSVHAVFLQRESEVAACCPYCLREFGRFDANYGSATYRQLGVIREVGHLHQCQESK